MNPSRQTISRFCTVCAFALVVLFATSATAQTVRKADELLNGWQMKSAKTAIDQLEKRYPKEAAIFYLKARLAFFEGDYTLGVDLLDRAIKAYPTNAYWKQLREVMDNTKKVTKKYKRIKSPKGYFEVFVQPGKDEILVPYALEVLDIAYVAIGNALQHRPPTPIRVEVYPTTATLAKVSSLTEKDIRTSGTIALCKYNRLMITSPKALLKGYEWADTLVHEYVHYVINHKTSANVPIWMHEGMAKYLERRWRGPNNNRLSSSSEHLLRERLEKNKLITFDQMHPSMAKLPSQEDAAVAFAEVYTVMEYLNKKLGEAGFALVLEQINKGDDAKKAFAKVLETTFPAFERAWKAYLKTRPKVTLPKDEVIIKTLKFKGDKNIESDLKKIPKPKARDHMHLGEMMQARKRFKAALVQYKKAARIMGKDSRVLQTRLAQTHLALKQYKEAYEVLKPMHQHYPSDVRIWMGMGEAKLGLKQYKLAIKYLVEAVYINPFDPRVHELLARAYEYNGQSDKAQLAMAHRKKAL